jgi:translation initiation factor 3 subunit C
LDEEFVKVLKGCDAHSNEYVDRLKDEPRVVAILESAQKLIEKKQGSAADLCRIYLKRVEHVYFKFDAIVIKQKHVSRTNI